MQTLATQIKSLESRTGPIPGSLANSIGLGLALTAAYFLFGRLAFAMAISEGSATSVAFLPEGIALTSTILFGARVAPGILLGQTLLSWSLGVPWAVGAAFGFINMVEGICGGLLFWHWRISPSLRRPRDVAMLFGLSALLLQPLAAAVKAIPRMAIASPDSIFHLSLYSWAGNTMGQFLMVPLLLTWCSSGFRVDPREFRRGLLIVSLYFGAIAVFKILRLGERDPLYWLTIFGAFYLVLIWVAARSRVQTTAFTNLITTMALLATITSSPDSLLYFSTQDRVLYTDILILGGIATALLISALFGQLIERTAELRQANAAKEKILAVIGHDLRGPVGNLKSALDLLQSGTITSADFRDFQSDLHHGVNSAQFTLENLMEWGGSQMNEIHPRPSPVDLRLAADSSIELLRLQATAKAIVIENLVPDNALVRVDQNQIGSVLRNLISNALKFTPDGGRIVLSGRRRGDAWEFSVRDTGCGMSASQAAGLFEKNREIVSSLGTANERGLGLGLQISRDFVEANSGTIRVESTPGEGSTFTVTLPTAG